ncbi:MAG: tetratricopeptide repeat protein [Akkermansia sp.]
MKTLRPHANMQRRGRVVREAAGSARLREHILFEQAHYAAKRMNPEATELLAAFVALAEDPALKTQARLDQAEVALNLNPPDIQTVQSILPLLEKEQLTPDQSMQLGRLKILLAENLQEWTEAIQACRQTIALNKDGKQADALYLKLGELLYKNGDFHEAQLVLQPFPRYPDSPLKAAALFLAGKAAQQSNTVNTLEAALNIFQTLGAGTTQFAQAAKIEEASVLLRMGKADQCIAVLDELLSKPLPRYMRLLALSIQADAWVTGRHPLRHPPQGHQPVHGNPEYSQSGTGMEIQNPYPAGPILRTAERPGKSSG